MSIINVAMFGNKNKSSVLLSLLDLHNETIQYFSSIYLQGRIIVIRLKIIGSFSMDQLYSLFSHPLFIDFTTIGENIVDIRFNCPQSVENDLDSLNITDDSYNISNEWVVFRDRSLSK